TYHLSEPMFDNQQDVYDSQLQIEHSNVFELSDSSSQSESDIDDCFKTFEQIRKKLDRYVMECGFAVRKGHTHPDDQRNRDAIVTGCKRHCNFLIGNTATEIRCSLIDDDCSNCHMQGHNIRL
ncbi:3292_t:CDS:2, partial [Gigaspora rosea]